MIKGITIPIPAGVKTLVHKATKPTVVSVRTCGSSLMLGDTTITITNGFRLKCQDCHEINLANNDELYAISEHGCNLTAFISA